MCVKWVKSRHRSIHATLGGVVEISLALINKTRNGSANRIQNLEN
jgi:hypothetical protein